MRASARRDHGLIKTDASPHCKLRSVNLRSVRWAKGFWSNRFRQCREVTLPHLWDLLNDRKQGHALANRHLAAGLKEGDFTGSPWQDGWIYKWIEAASSFYAATGDRRLDAQMDEVIEEIARAQPPDGYLALESSVRDEPRSYDTHHHALHVIGHLITAACIHHRVTGKQSLLNIARRAADHVWATFRECGPKLARLLFHPTIIMAGVELYRTTGVSRYLEMANHFIDSRGALPGGTDQAQDFLPLRREREVVGHMVLATHLYAGAADAYMETGDPSLLEALERLWQDLTEHKLYVNGGCCAYHRALSVCWPGDGGSPTSAYEVSGAAGPAYDLPNATAHNEACAQIGSVMWNWRMLAITGEARYADVIERTVYNSILSAIGLDGVSWFSTNPLRCHGEEHLLLSGDTPQRFAPEPERACCPSSVLHFIAEWHGYLYSISEEGLWLHHYGAGTLEETLANGMPVRVIQETRYPWEGEIELTLEMPAPADFTFRLRIPEWVEEAYLLLNDRPLDVAAVPGSYARIRRTWLPGDRLCLILPMEPCLIEAHPRVEQLRGQVAVMRGPILYCLESPDLTPGVRVSEVQIPADARWSARYRSDLLGGITTLESEAIRVPEGDWRGRLYRPLQRQSERVPIRLVPYYAWANRGVSEMTVWMPVQR